MKTAPLTKRFSAAFTGTPVSHALTAVGITLLGYLLIFLHAGGPAASLPWHSVAWGTVPFLLGTLAVIALQFFDFRGSYLPFSAFLYLTSLGMIYRFSLSFPETVSDAAPPAGVELDEAAATLLAPSEDMVLVFCALAVIGGIVLLFGRERISVLRKRYYLLFVVSVALLFLCVVWMKIVDTRFLYSRTPWELMKVIVVIALSGFFADNMQRFRHRSLFSRSALALFWAPLGVMWLIPQFLFVFMGDTGQLMIYSVFVVLFIYAATRRTVFLILGIVLIAGSFDILASGISIFPQYIQDRFLVWSDLYNGFPSDTWWDRSCQAFQGFFAMRSGGVLGTGPGQGYPGLVPLADSDFAYAGISELFGLCGVFLLFSLYLALILSGASISERAPHQFERFMAIGLVLLFSSQVIVNVAGVLNLIPLTGITLPFVSKGGFSYITNALIIGLLMALSDRKKRGTIRTWFTRQG